MEDNINPAHYNTAGIQPIDFMKGSMSHDAYCGFLSGNVIKYVSRYKKKNGVEDLKKAEQYLKWLIEGEDQ